MALSREDLWKQLRRREIAPVYVLFGPETYLRELAAKTIADLAFADGDLRDFNETNFSLNTEGNLERAFAAAEALPMMASRRVIRITDIRVSATGFRDTITEAHESALSVYLSDPSPSSVVILSADELNGVRKMGKFLRSSGVAVEFKRLDDGELAKWAKAKINESGVRMDEGTLRYLIARAGPDVRRLTNEINKLAAAAMPDNVVTPELIDALVPDSRELSNFELTDHLVAGRTPRALAVLRKILDDGAEPVALMGLISYNYRRLLMAKELMEQGADRGEVGSAVKLLRYGDQEPFLAAARRAPKPSLINAIKRLAAADVAIKTSMGGGGPVAARMQIEMLVCELAGN